MFAIAFQELKKQIKSIKSILIILIIFSITMGVASLGEKYKSLIAMGGESNVYTLGLTMTILIAGPLFTLTLSHNIINEEIKDRTIRFIATKTSRLNIVIGKFLGLTFFWAICLIISTLLISFFAHDIYIQKALICFSFLLYFIGLAILLSTMISNPIVTNLLGVSFSIIITIIGLWSTFSNNIFLKFFSYITPYHYFLHEENSLMGYIPVLFTIVFVFLSLFIIKRRDL